MNQSKTPELRVRMGQARPPPVPLPRPLQPLAAALAALLLAAGLSGCSGLWRQRLPLMLYVAVSVPDGRVTTETSKMIRRRFGALLADFRRLHPNVLLQSTIYTDSQLVRQLAQRNEADLGPDLILTGDAQANELLRVGLVDPLPVDAEVRANTSATLLARLRDSRGRHAGQPIVTFPQLACYDRRRLPSAPTRLQQLLEAAAGGTRIGLPLKLRGLLWSAGAFNALPALVTASQGGTPSAEQRQALLAWASWLQEANGQHRMSFYADEVALRDALASGQLDWVTCHSADLLDLRRSLGNNLGVAPLPAGPAHGPTPMTLMRVMALGTNSSPAQRAMAVKLARFSIQPLVQRSLTLETLSFLPANPLVSVPVQSSSALAAMVLAEEQAGRLDSTVAGLNDGDPRVDQVNGVIVQLVFAVLEPAEAVERLLDILQNER